MNYLLFNSVSIDHYINNWIAFCDTFNYAFYQTLHKNYCIVFVIWVLVDFKTYLAHFFCLARGDLSDLLFVFFVDENPRID